MSRVRADQRRPQSNAPAFVGERVTYMGISANYTPGFSARDVDATARGDPSSDHSDLELLSVSQTAPHAEARTAPESVLPSSKTSREHRASPRRG